MPRSVWRQLLSIFFRRSFRVLAKGYVRWSFVRLCLRQWLGPLAAVLFGKGGSTSVRRQRQGDTLPPVDAKDRVMKVRSEFHGSSSEERQASPDRPDQAAVALRAVTVLDRGEIQQLTLDPEQEQFAGSVDAVFDALRESPHPRMEHPFAIVAGTQTVGFLVLREKLALPDWAPGGAVTLHSFRIHEARQGMGYGRAAVGLAISWVRARRRTVSQLMLAVNVRNTPAKALYLKSGFVDTGRIVHGPIGDQHILAFRLGRV
jgi:cysteine synthase A